jgi:hypothetical protein
LFVFVAVGGVAAAKTVVFAGHTWTVKSGLGIGPGPNDWSADNVWVDKLGALHLRLTHRNGRWQCAELITNDRLGFGQYQFWVVGRIDKLDPNVVLGLFSYPTADVGPDGTNEIDIEFAKWGRADAPALNYTVWPVKKALGSSHSRYPIELTGTYTTHRFYWSPTEVSFQSLHGHYDNNTNQFAQWLFQPNDAALRIGRQPMPLDINLWLFHGQPPADGREVEFVIRSFKFTPAQPENRD